jgi:hypothetical protein
MVAARLYISAEDATEVLDRLCADNLLSCPGGIYRFDPQPPERRALVDRLAELYSRHLIPVTSLVHTKPPRIRAFADAFKLRKDRKDR